MLLQAQGAFDAAYQRAEMALELADEEGDVYGELAALTALTDAYLLRRIPAGTEASEAARRTFTHESLKKAAEWQRILLDKLAVLNDVLAELPEANKLALICEKLEQPEEALELHQRTLALANQLQSRRHQATAWLYLGEWHRKQRRFGESVEALKRCLALADEDSKPEVRIALGGVYQAMQQDAEALQQFELAWEQVRKTDELPRHLVCLREIADVRMRLGQRDNALAALQEALDVAHALELRGEEARLREQLEQWRAGQSAK